MKYKGFEAQIYSDFELNLFHGEIIAGKDIITFQADCFEDIQKEFHKSVDVYLEFCEEINKNEN